MSGGDAGRFQRPTQKQAAPGTQAQPGQGNPHSSPLPKKHRHCAGQRNQQQAPHTPSALPGGWRCTCKQYRLAWPDLLSRAHVSQKYTGEAALRQLARASASQLRMCADNCSTTDLHAFGTAAPPCPSANEPCCAALRCAVPDFPRPHMPQIPLRLPSLPRHRHRKYPDQTRPLVSSVPLHYHPKQKNSPRCVSAHEGWHCLLGAEKQGPCMSETRR